MDLIPGQGTKILHVMWPTQNKKLYIYIPHTNTNQKDIEVAMLISNKVEIRARQIPYG